MPVLYTFIHNIMKIRIIIPFSYNFINLQPHVPLRALIAPLHTSKLNILTHYSLTNPNVSCALTNFTKCHELLVLTLDLPAIVKSVQVNTVPLWTIQPLFKKSWSSIRFRPPTGHTLNFPSSYISQRTCRTCCINRGLNLPRDPGYNKPISWQELVKRFSYRLSLEEAQCSLVRDYIASDTLKVTFICLKVAFVVSQSSFPDPFN